MRDTHSLGLLITSLSELIKKEYNSQYFLSQIHSFDRVLAFKNEIDLAAELFKRLYSEGTFEKLIKYNEVMLVEDFKRSSDTWNSKSTLVDICKCIIMPKNELQHIFKEILSLEYQEKIAYYYNSCIVNEQNKYSSTVKEELVLFLKRLLLNEQLFRLDSLNSNNHYNPPEIFNQYSNTLYLNWLILGSFFPKTFPLTLADNRKQDPHLLEILIRQEHFKGELRKTPLNVVETINSILPREDRQFLNKLYYSSGKNLDNIGSEICDFINQLLLEGRFFNSEIHKNIIADREYISQLQNDLNTYSDQAGITRTHSHLNRTILEIIFKDLILPSHLKFERWIKKHHLYQIPRDISKTIRTRKKYFNLLGDNHNDQETYINQDIELVKSIDILHQLIQTDIERIIVNLYFYENYPIKSIIERLNESHPSDGKWYQKRVKNIIDALVKKVKIEYNLPFDSSQPKHNFKANILSFRFLSIDKYYTDESFNKFYYLVCGVDSAGLVSHPEVINCKSISELLREYLKGRNSNLLMITSDYESFLLETLSEYFPQIYWQFSLKHLKGRLPVNRTTNSSCNKIMRTESLEIAKEHLEKIATLCDPDLRKKTNNLRYCLTAFDKHVKNIFKDHTQISMKLIKSFRSTLHYSVENYR